MGNRKLRFAVFGLGDFGPELTGYIAEVADVVAICDPNPEARAQFQETTGLEVAGFDNHQQLLAEADIDAVAVISPNFTHKDIAVAAARAGKHVYCEKPMATTVSECWEMVQACQSANVRLMVGHKRRLRPPWAHMIELREKLGEVVAITSCLYHDARPYDFKGWWTRQGQCGGTMAIAGVHVIDWMRAMCGDVAAVRAVPGAQIDSRYDFPDTIHVSLDFRSGAVATLNVSLAYPPMKFREAAGPLVVCRKGGMRMVPAITLICITSTRMTRNPNTNVLTIWALTTPFAKKLAILCGGLPMGSNHVLPGLRVCAASK